MRRLTLTFLVVLTLARPALAQENPATQPAELRIELRAHEGFGQGLQQMQIQFIAGQAATTTQPADAPATAPDRPGVRQGAVIRGNVRIMVGGGVIRLQPAQPQVDSAAPEPEPPATQPAPAAVTAPEAVNDDIGGLAIGAVRTIDANYDKPRLLGLTLTGQKGAPGDLKLYAGGSRQNIALDGLVRIVVPSGGPDRGLFDRMPDNAVAVLLGSGEWLAGLISGGDQRQVSLSIVGVGEIPVSLKDLRGVVAPAGRAGQNPAQLERILLTDTPAVDPTEAVNDTVRLANGETVTGTIVRIDPKGLAIQGQGAAKELTLGMDVLLVAQLANPKPDRPRDRGLSAWVELSSGSRLLAEKLQWQGRTLRVTRPGAAEPLLVSDQYVTAIEIIDGRWRWLDTATPLLAEHRPFMTVRWPARFGANVAGGVIRIGDRAFQHGIGVHSASRLIFPIAGASRFQCVAGLDATAGPLADVDIQVLVDEQVKFERKGVKPSDKAISIKLDVAGGQKLELRVEFGANGDVQDRFNWADAALVM